LVVSQESLFFFEKKKKNPYLLGFSLWLARMPICKSFLLLFFKKEVLS